ncbi:interactor of constitutive active ROPs 3-like isoform X2 [Typha angustifolia]|uniref:interactor of constitutive active ROPs 3-like isoform X2 n=1 Tax=Typha angustifolia TaxID=59011 RepID=UPI003C2DA6C4
MQTPKTRNGSSDVPQKTSLATPRKARVSKTGGNESDSPGITPTKTPTERSPKVIQRRSPRSPATEKKRPSRISELESQVCQLQEELKKAKDQLSSDETWKKQAQQEAEESKQHLQAITSKLEDSQQQLVEFSAAEEGRLQELRKISQERDRAWQSELEAIQKQHSVDSAALGSAMSEIQRLKEQLEMAAKSEAAQEKNSEEALSELHALKQDMAAALSTIESFKIHLRDSEKAEADARAKVSESQQQLDMAKTTIESLCSEGSKLQESLRSKVSELEESQAQIKSLEAIVKKLEAKKIVVEEADTDKSSKTSNNGSLEMEIEIEKLRSALETAEAKYREEQTQNAMKIRTADEMLESFKMESGLKASKLELELSNKNAELAELKARLAEKELELDGIAASSKDLSVNQTMSELETNLMKSITDIAELKANLMDKETELQSILDENEMLKAEIGKKEMESHEKYEEAVAELELAKAAEQEVRMRLGSVTEEVDKSSRRAARVAEQLDAAQAMNSEMETELRRLRVQSDQWRKAAEAAAAALSTTTTTGNNGKFMERTGSMDSGYNSIGGKLMSSPFSDDLDDESPKKKNNGSVLRRMSGLWKKSPK